MKISRSVRWRTLLLGVLANMIREKEISTEEAWLLLLIDDVMDLHHGACGLTNQEIGDHCGIGVRRVQSILSVLERKGLLRREPDRDQNRTLFVLAGPVQRSSEGVTFSSRGPSNLRGDNPPFRGGFPPTPRTEKKIIKVRRISHCDDCSGVDWRELGEQLRKGISRVAPVPKTAKPVQWGASIMGLHTREGLPSRHIKDILSWYCGALADEGNILTNGNPNFLPVAFSGDSFRKKFQKLEAAKARDKGQGRTMKVSRKKVERSSRPAKIRDDKNFYAGDW